MHDAQCLIYHGPDKQFEGHEICYGYNEDSLSMQVSTFDQMSSTDKAQL